MAVCAVCHLCDVWGACLARPQLPVQCVTCVMYGVWHITGMTWAAYAVCQLGHAAMVFLAPGVGMNFSQVLMVAAQVASAPPSAQAAGLDMVSAYQCSAIVPSTSAMWLSNGGV
jgi:hypothetical protein